MSGSLGQCIPSHWQSIMWNKFGVDSSSHFPFKAWTHTYTHTNPPSHETSPPKVIWQEHVATPHARDRTRPLHVQYPLQTNPITQLWVSYIYTAMTHASSTLHCASSPIPLPKKRNLPLPKLEIFTPKDPIGTMEKWTIAYNSAYVQTETFNFTFAQQASIVYAYLCSTAGVTNKVSPSEKSASVKIVTPDCTWSVL